LIVLYIKHLHEVYQNLEEATIKSHPRQNLWTQEQEQIQGRSKVYFYLCPSYVKGVANTVKNQGKSPAQLEAEYYEKKKLKKQK
jgi:hypothetical protein